MRISLQYRATTEFAKTFLVAVISALALLSVEVAVGAQPTPPPIEVERPKIPIDVQGPRITLELLQTPLVQQPAISGGAFACMADGGDPSGRRNRDLAGALRSSNDMTNQACRSTCERGGFAFAGTQGGGHCFCGNTYGKYGEAAAALPPRSCNLGCAGNPNEICGGEWANSVSLTGVAPPPPTDGGQCLVKARGGYTTTGGAAGSYNSVELHRFEKLATTASSSTNKTYTFRYTMTVSGYMDQTGAGSKWRGSWGGSQTSKQTWHAVPATNPATGMSAWRLRTTQASTINVPYTGHLLTNPLQADPRTSVTVSAFAYPTDVYSTGSSFVFPATTGTTTQAGAGVRLWNNPLGDATYTCSWNVTL